MNKVYLVVCTSGSYSDWSMENICAYLDHTAAELDCLDRNKQIERLRLAKEKQYEHMREWIKNNPAPDYEVKRKLTAEYNKLTHNKGKKSLTDRDRAQLRNFEAKIAEWHESFMSHRTAYAAEEKNFIMSLASLTDEDKEIITNPDAPRYYQTDGDYHVEEIELKG